MKKGIRNIDFPLMFLTLSLAIFGIIMIFSASSYAAVLQYYVSETYFAMKQAVVLIVGIVISLIIMKIPTRYYTVLSRIFMFLIILVLVGIKIYGTASHNATSWIKKGIFGLQPSEFSKTFIILYLACYYGNKKKFKQEYDIFLPLIPCILVFGLVLIEPDRGTAMIIALITMFIFFSLPFPKGKYLKIIRTLLVVGILAAGVILVFADDIFKSSEALSRFNYQKPCSRYLEDTGYQVCNGYIAINNGNLFGVGLGKSTQKYLYLPEAHTDFIFAIIIEELGVIIGGIILIVYILILYRILVIARNAVTLRGSILAFGTFAYILIHIVVNLGGLLALIPLTGVPLPFLSYGGSFMLNLIILLALTQRVAIENKEERNVAHE